MCPGWKEGHILPYRFMGRWNTNADHDHMDGLPEDRQMRGAHTPRTRGTYADPAEGHQRRPCGGMRQHTLLEAFTKVQNVHEVCVGPLGADFKNMFGALTDSWTPTRTRGTYADPAEGHQHRPRGGMRQHTLLKTFTKVQNVHEVCVGPPYAYPAEVHQRQPGRGWEGGGGGVHTEYS